jgi:hypothetical protein
LRGVQVEDVVLVPAPEVGDLKRYNAVPKALYSDFHGYTSALSQVSNLYFFFMASMAAGIPASLLTPTQR